MLYYKDGKNTFIIDIEDTSFSDKLDNGINFLRQGNNGPYLEEIEIENFLSF